MNNKSIVIIVGGWDDQGRMGFSDSIWYACSDDLLNPKCVNIWHKSMQNIPDILSNQGKCFLKNKNTNNPILVIMGECQTERFIPTQTRIWEFKMSDIIDTPILQRFLLDFNSVTILVCYFVFFSCFVFCVSLQSHNKEMWGIRL